MNNMKKPRCLDASHFPLKLCGATLAIGLVAGMTLLSSQSLFSQQAQLAALPPMGWNSWNHFGRNVSDADVRAAADAMVATGMKAAGYLYVNIDDGWQGTRDAEGNIHGNERFPNMKALADYVHSKGLKLGIYSSPGPRTCAGFEGSFGHEEQDARTYASWGVDYLKYDLCSFRTNLAEASDEITPKEREQLVRADGDPRATQQIAARLLANLSSKQILLMEDAYRKMSLALEKTGRPIVYSLCQYGLGDVWKWGASVGGNLWRTEGDIHDNYVSMSSIGFGQLDIADYAGPGHWNDPDMLEVGNGGMNNDEYQTHMSLWALLAAPLLAGNDLSRMTPETLRILTNPDVIAVDQDSLGKQGVRAWASGAQEIWTKTLGDDSVAVGLFNRAETPVEIKLNLAVLGLRGAPSARDLWTGRDLGRIHDDETFSVPGHGVVMLRLTK
jgi:alpha-galactosidase